MISASARRNVIVALMRRHPREAVSLPESAVAPDARGDRERLRVELVHTHLPKMADGGFVEWDRDPLRARRGPRFDEVAAVLRAIQGHDGIPSHLVEGCHYLGETEPGL